MYIVVANVANDEISSVYVAPEIALHLKVKPSSTTAPPTGLVNVTAASVSCAVLNDATLEVDERYPFYCSLLCKFQ